MTKRKTERQARGGQIYPAKTLFFRVHVGEAEAPDGTKYEMSTSVGDGTPIIHCLKTGLWFTLTWPQILDLAEKAGIRHGRKGGHK